ncbi:MAG: glycosyltransferase family 4 protein [Rubrivivax sp.]|nr:glycosyltransferase family 4 protein [Rubrivivax sp.]
MRVGCLTRYDDLGASSRVRFSQYLAPMARLAPDLLWQRQSLLDGAYLRRKYAGLTTTRDTLRCYARRAADIASQPLPDLWWVEKELWPYAPAWLERTLLSRRPYALDLDDAIFHNYDLHPLALVRRALGHKIDRLMEGAALVTAGNAYLAARALAAGARRVETVPTVIDLDRYPLRTTTASPDIGPIDIAWIGSPATVGYLQALARPLAQLAAARRIRLVVIGGGSLRLPGVEVIARPWSADTEAAEIARCHIGVMPLPDSPWERGKCGYKLIQYMACGLPVVASPVGVNCEIVRPGHNGWLADDDAHWLRVLTALVEDAPSRLRLGRAGRETVERQYSVQAVAPRLAALLRRAALPFSGRTD